MTHEELKQLTYEERCALPVIRKLLKRRPEVATLLMQGMAKEVAVNVLMQAQKELADLLAISHAFSEAAGAIAKLDQPTEQS